MRLKRRYLDRYGANETVARDVVRLMGIQLQEREAIAFARSVWEREPRLRKRAAAILRRIESALSAGADEQGGVNGNGQGSE